MYKIQYREKIKPYQNHRQGDLYELDSDDAESDEPSPRAYEPNGLHVLQEETDFLPDEIFLRTK